jgi:hypothetical protein
MSLNLFLNKRFSIVLEPAVLDEAHGGTHQSSYTRGDLLYASATNVLSKLGVGTVGQLLSSDGNIPQWAEPYADPTRFFLLFEDWITEGGNPSGTHGWNAVFNGVSAGASVAHDNTITDGTVQGAIYLDTGTSSTGRCSIRLHDNAMVLGGGQLICWMRFYLPDLSDGTNTYVIRVGLGDSSSGDYQNGVYFEYSHGTNSGKWVGRTAQADTRTSLNTNTAVVAGDWIPLKFIVNSDASSVEFFIDGVSQGTITTNIPNTSALPTGPRLQIVKSAGGSSRKLYTDYYGLFQRFTSTR